MCMTCHFTLSDRDLNLGKLKRVKLRIFRSIKSLCLTFVCFMSASRVWLKRRWEIRMMSKRVVNHWHCRETVSSVTRKSVVRSGWAMKISHCVRIIVVIAVRHRVIVVMRDRYWWSTWQFHKCRLETHWISSEAQLLLEVNTHVWRAS